MKSLQIILVFCLLYLSNSKEEAKEMTCLDGYIKINAYTCAKSQDFKVASKCKVNQECWNGVCVDSKEEIEEKCPSMVTCSSNYGIRCPDNQCVEDVSECNDYFECPTFNPIRCPNGECRTSLDDCPSLLRCPSPFFMLCNDNSCRSTSDVCEIPSELTQCIDQSMTRCADGTCVSAKFLCPTAVTCNKGMELCWNGICANKGECSKPSTTTSSAVLICDSEKEVLCTFDYTCRSSLSLCPTGIICPVDRPVRCWDNSCKESVDLCPEYQSCPTGLVECPDGSCSKDKQCNGVHITCSSEAPYRCYDNTCRRDPDDCPDMPNCPSTAPILCWDGRCVSDRGTCLSPTACSPATLKVKCPSGICKYTAEECKETTDCPNLFIKCPSGECRQDEKDCEEQTCPLNFPYKCDNGLCVSDKNNCEKENGCPYYNPIKCENGKCVNNEEECKNNTIECGPNEHACPDGSCLPTENICPLDNGCSSDTPRLCADGTCIDPKKESCPIPICPSDTPILCTDGHCANTQGNCPEILRGKNDEGNVICANGLEAKYYEECKPLYSCGENARCGDGSCRQSIDYCPQVNVTCPAEYPYRCDDGSCAEDETMCINLQGCPEGTPHKCTNSGLCVKTIEECNTQAEQFSKSNGCSQATPIKCDNGRCEVSSDQCDDEISEFCTDEKPILCSDGKSCVDNPRDCGQCGGGAKYCNMSMVCIDESKECIDCPLRKPYLCTYPDNSTECVSPVNDCLERNGTLSQDEQVEFKCDASLVSCPSTKVPCASSYEDCFTDMNCKLSEPFRCNSGECKKYPFQSTDDDTEGCEISIKCPSYHPYLCSDGSCVAKSTFCETKNGCENGLTMCFDRTCDTEENCKNHMKCPAKSPIQCNANCMDSMFDCLDSSCPTWKPFKCVYGSCKESPRECLQNPSKSNDTTTGYGTICSENEFVCYDGTCRKNATQCPLFAGCTSPDKPYKCPSGICKADKESCPESTWIPEDDEEVCEDGIVRKKDTCPDYNGCPFEAPLLCSNGECVHSLSECAGISNCENTDKPFRCMNGQCVASLSECSSIKREYGSTDIKLSVYPYNDLTTNIVIGANNLAISSIYFPTDSLGLVDSTSNESIEGVVQIQSVPRNTLTETYSTFDETRTDDIMKIYPYADPEGKNELSFEYTVLSTAVRVSLDDTTIKFKGDILLTLLYDFPSKHEALSSSESSVGDFMDLDPLKDVCLAVLNGTKWECYGDFSVQSLENFQLSGIIKQEGVYAVMLNPRINETPLKITSNFLIDNLLVISIVFVIVLIIIGVGIYVFTRIYRYRGKYIQAKDKFNQAELELKEMSDKSTQIVGQTIGDAKEGVIFTDNPAFNLKYDEKISKRTIQLEKLHNDYTKKLSALERNNAKLKETYNNMKEDYDKLQKYIAENKGENVQMEIKITKEEVVTLETV